MHPPPGDGAQHQPQLRAGPALKTQRPGGRYCRTVGSIPGRSTGSPMAKPWVTEAEEKGHRVHVPILTDTLPPRCAQCQPPLLLGAEVSGARRMQRASCRFFFLKKKKKKRNRDFISGNPLPQQRRIQPAPAAAGLGGDGTDPESGGGSEPRGRWVSGSGMVGRGGALSRGGCGRPAPRCGWRCGAMLPALLPAWISWTASWRGCSGSLPPLPPGDLAQFWGSGCPRGTPQRPPKLCRRV